MQKLWAHLMDAADAYAYPPSPISVCTIICICTQSNVPLSISRTFNLVGLMMKMYDGSCKVNGK